MEAPADRETVVEGWKTMASARRGIAELRTLGLGEQEAGVYLLLLDRPRSLEELSKDLELDDRRARSVLGLLTRRGLVHRLPGTTQRFALTPPDWTLPGLLVQREQESRRLHEFVDSMTQRFRLATQEDPVPDYLRVVAGAESVVAEVNAGERQAKREILYFVKAPILSADNLEAEESLSRGVATRALWERELLESPGMVEEARAWAARGGEDRVVASLPSKMMIVDQKVAYVNVTETSEGQPLVASLITKHPELVGTLCRLFDLLWGSAVPLFESPITGKQAMDHSAVSQIVPYLKAGLTDDAIARQLGVSRRTIVRRVRGLMDRLGVETRFQAGFKLRDTDFSA